MIPERARARARPRASASEQESERAREREREGGREREFSRAGRCGDRAVPPSTTRAGHRAARAVRADGATRPRRRGGALCACACRASGKDGGRDSGRWGVRGRAAGRGARRGWGGGGEGSAFVQCGAGIPGVRGGARGGGGTRAPPPPPETRTSRIRLGLRRRRRRALLGAGATDDSAGDRCARLARAGSAARHSRRVFGPAGRVGASEAPRPRGPVWRSAGAAKPRVFTRPILRSDLVRVHPGRPAAHPMATRSCGPGPLVHDYRGRGAPSHRLGRIRLYVR